MRASGIPTNSTACCVAIGERQRFRVGQADIFAGENDDAARDETEIFAGMQHFREPVDRAFFVRSAHAFDEGADRVVVRVARAIVDDRFLLNAFLGDGEGEMDEPSERDARSSCCEEERRRRRRRRQDADFERVQTFARVAVAELGEVPARVGVDLAPCIAEAALFVGQGAIDQFFELLDPERLELKNLRARDQRAVHVEKRIVSRRADQAQVSALDVGQQNVLLRFVEVMDFVHEQDRFLAGRAEPVGRGGDDSAHFGDVAFHAAEPLEFRVGHVGDDMGEGGFAGAGRAGQNDGRQTVGLDRAAQQFSRREDVFLADKFLQRARAHPGGERRGAVDLRGVVGLFPGK